MSSLAHMAVPDDVLFMFDLILKGKTDMAPLSKGVIMTSVITGVVLVLYLGWCGVGFEFGYKRICPITKESSLNNAVSGGTEWKPAGHLP